MVKEDIITKIEYKIHVLRKRMISTAHLKGFNHHETIKCSQELDIFLNKYQQLNH